ncbi:hypothetical protein SAMN02745136_04768 [Anaerocolumna jejuensis DSM 15929]|uniref:Plasmid recombination enzyme n=1 Tax=Anaerocolumna jejuensis DSM 15929 TaxID=1121322 RepID=A0A1M7A6R0_9FIRM|nr:hypothetical protein [Anaerocolumna jejuensis]SHL38326.1 hypothetical protein SAMN02745136_04768 [Anaerocolumna jejuensis DSM 15929]
MEKQRATHHSGRKSRRYGAFSNRHNDRNYDYEKAHNINADLTPYNAYYNIYDGTYRHSERENKMTYEEVEEKFYTEKFYQQYQNTNQKYIDRRQYKRCKSFEEWCKMDSNLPEELHMQIGKVENPCDEKTFLQVFNLYIKKLNKWNALHGNPFTVMNMSFHIDETAPPHIQLRRVWHYTNDDGVLCIGQEKALEQAGIALPEPNKKKGRYNNRKQIFDKMARNIFLDCCKQYGLDIETIPVPHARHNMSKEEMIDQKFADKQREIEKKEEQIKEKANALSEAQKAVFDAETDVHNKSLVLEEKKIKISDMQATATQYLTRAKMIYDNLNTAEHEEFQKYKAKPLGSSLHSINKLNVQLNESLAPHQRKSKENQMSL